jgi:hypothetical protein
MKWQGRRTSQNVEDRRGRSIRGLAGGGIGTIIIVLIYMLMGGNPSVIMENSQFAGQPSSVEYVETEEEKELAQFVSVVLAETEDVWTEVLAKENIVYEYPKLVLFSGSVDSACGTAGASTGPFYCPGDQSVYIDLSFYQELQQRFAAPGDFAMAYVIAHEVGHHVQNLLGITDQVMALRQRVSETEYNRYSVRMELQADYLAGVWAYHAQRMNILEEGDIDEALNAASAIGDDRIQRNTYGYVVPDSFTHGTSEQRRRWFYKGFEAGDLSQGDTFALKDDEL